PEDNGDDILAVTVGLNLPIYRKRIRSGVLEATRRLESTRFGLENIQDSLRFEVQSAVIHINSTEDRATLYRDVLIPQAEESLASAEAAYTTDRQGFLDLLDAERILFQVRLTYHRLLSDYWIALSELERAVGSRFPDTDAQGADATHGRSQ
ncbi:MAG: TolC family protein, partial [Acidobacteriota bacterium]